MYTKIKLAPLYRTCYQGIFPAHLQLRYLDPIHWMKVTNHSSRWHTHPQLNLCSQSLRVRETLWSKFLENDRFCRLVAKNSWRWTVKSVSRLVLTYVTTRKIHKLNFGLLYCLPVVCTTLPQFLSRSPYINHPWVIDHTAKNKIHQLTFHTPDCLPKVDSVYHQFLHHNFHNDQ